MANPIRLSGFSGLIPRVGKRLLPDNAATIARAGTDTITTVDGAAFTAITLYKGESIMMASDGSVWQGVCGATNPAQRTQEFTSSGTWTAPAGVTSVYVSGIGGGGCGAGTSGITTGCGAGGQTGQAVIRKKLTVTPGTAYTVTIGSGGGATLSGGNTSFGALVTLSGGGGGLCYWSVAAGGSMPGQSSPFGSGGAGRSTSGNGNNAAANSGAGGGGAYSSTASTLTGGTGGSGYLLVEW